ncbi:uncharacterized protein Nmag_0136 [Natrialba magadii ATCC 43099]|uniref:Uncharacterized protein n=1 Tax=Natrialba magadii (strain ATCC 43099 / DSM 3394 / CCM 3739 / CIP 104546 / IAM 13178 / JCM 8861 / NBRC 102185 / NCIMB 2190 / MS3) TaxID=547559 RepID=D3SWE1_NATMM|nr:polysialyltransferase family glycosyltransferase [Natrialba magadii]ADD03733.1 uncharacterized protein Nmag_0136 [Natrialba magadii ATCC 43099]ELY33788.1 hypothetical protein C500_01143 [Natrialba magadii ATCC 43099]
MHAEFSSLKGLLSHCDKLIATRDIDFIASGRMPLNALSIDAELSSRREYNNGIIVLRDKGGEFLIGEDDFQATKDCNVEMVKYTQNGGGNKDQSKFGFKWPSITQIAKPIAAAGCALRRDQDRYPIDIISTGDWYKAFMPLFFISKNKKYSPQFISLNTILKYDDRSRTSKTKVEHYLSPSLRITKKDLYKWESGNILIDEDVAKTHQEYLSTDISYDPDTIVMLTQPFSETGQITQEEEYRIVSDLISELGDLGYQILLKPHPREHANKYKNLIGRNDVEILGNEKGEPIERQIAKYDAHAVIGYNSTALLTISAFYDLDVYTAEPFLRNKTTYESDIRFSEVTEGLLIEYTSGKSI